MYGEAPKSTITGVPGWESQAEQELLVILARQLTPGQVIVEIGSEFGMSTSLFCYAAHPDVFIHAVDLFPGDMLENHKANMQEAGFGERKIVYHQGDSGSFRSFWVSTAQRAIDLLFIDGDHTYEGVKRDIENWTPFVSPDGKVVFHDCACMTNTNPHPLHYEVVRAVNEWYQANSHEWRMVNMIDSMMVFQRSEDAQVRRHAMDIWAEEWHKLKAKDNG